MIDSSHYIVKFKVSYRIIALQLRYMKGFTKTVLIIILVILSIIATVMLVVRHKKLKITRNRSEQLFEPKETTFNFPLLIAVGDIEKVANAKLKKILIDQRAPMNNGNDTLILKVTRLGNVSIDLDDHHFQSSIPLKVEIQYLKKVMKSNILLFKNKPLTLLMDASFESAFNLTENMKFITSTTLKEIKWLEEPTVKFMGFDIKLKDQINGLILEKTPELTRRLDSLLSTRIDIKKPVVRIWKNLQKSLKATKRQKDLYIRIQPRTLGFYIDRSMQDTLRLDLIVKSKVYMRFAEDTASIQKIAFPNKIEHITKEATLASSQLHLHCLLPLHKLNSIAKLKLEGKEFHVEGLDLKIEKIEITNGIRDIYVRLKHGGTIEGKVIMRGLPEFSKEEQRISIKRVSFENQLNDDVINSMTDLLHDELTEIVRDYSTFDVGVLMKSIPGFARTAIRKSKFAKKADVELERLHVDGLQVHLTKNNIQLMIDGHGDFEISLKKESFKVLRKGK